MIYIIEKLFYITLQGEARISIILRHSSKRFLKGPNTPVSTVSYSAGKGSRNKGRLKNRINYRKDSVMEQPIPNHSFVNMPLLGILNIEAFVGTMLVGFVFQFTMEPENVFFKVPLKSKDIGFISLVRTEFIPGRKKIFR